MRALVTPWLGVAAMLILLFAANAAADERLRIDVRDPTGRDYQVAVQRFSAEDALDPELGKDRDRLDVDLVSALEFSAVLKTVDPAAFLEPRYTQNFEAEQIACDNWRAVAADAVVQGRLRRVGSRLRADFRVWDVIRCRPQGDAAWYEANRESVSYLAQRIADDIVERFTGRRGVSATQIAFVSDQSGNKELYVMGADGSGKNRITENGSINLFPSWSPDGDSLLYTSYRGGGPDVWRLSRGRRKSGRLMNGEHTKLGATWSPRDGLVAVVLSHRSNTDIYVVGEDGRGLRRVTYSRSIETEPTWSPDGKRLAFVSDQSGSPQVYVRELASGEARRLTFEGSYNASPAWSPTGEWIAFAAKTGAGFDLYLIDPDSGFTTPLIVNPRNDEDPAWSPDGRKIVFVSDRRGRKELYSVDLGGQHLTRLTSEFGNSTNPAWGPWTD